MEFTLFLHLNNMERKNNYYDYKKEKETTLEITMKFSVILIFMGLIYRLLEHLVG